MPPLPEPASDAQAHSHQVQQHLRGDIVNQGGWIPFARYMDLALYAPGLGYYAAGATKFGLAGDFTTAPERSHLFGRCLAQQAAQILRETGGDILEIGAGSGKLACDLLLALEMLGILPQRYSILELSGELKARQQHMLAARAPHLLDKVQWLEGLPESFTGLILGNEVLDAMPVHLVVRKDSAWWERGVSLDAAGFIWQDQPIADKALLQTANALDVPEPYLTEINLAAPAFIRSLAESLQGGAIIMIDYGFPAAEYYHPQRNQGTLMCHYRHFAHGEPFFWPGLQDITAHVDFSAIAQAGVDHGCALLGYATQANFLINCGITQMLGEVSPDDLAHYLPLANQAQFLLSPAEMGELFKVIVLAKGMDAALLGFTRRNQAARL